MEYHNAARQWMAALSGDAWKAYSVIVDRTWGFQKQEEHISLSDFKRLMGLPPKHDSVVYRALRELFFFGLVARGKAGRRGEQPCFITTRITTNRCNRT